MAELRSAWTPEQVQENLGEANESLPEARPTDRFPVAGTASGIDVRGGADEGDGSTADEPDGGFRLPPDPPRRPTDEGGR